MINLNNSLNILIAVHHFPPTFKGGAEWRAHRTATWLQQQGHTVNVICVEAADDPETDTLRWVDDNYDGLAVRRLFLNLANAPNPAQWEYHNPWIEAHLAQYLAELKPDIFHLISGYLMTSAVIMAADKLNIPVVATLTDFWFLCPRITLQRATGQLCPKNSPLDCVRCQFEAKRRYRLPAQKTPGLTDFLWQRSIGLPIISEQISQIELRQQTLKQALKQVDVAICPSEFLKEMYLNRGFSAKEMHFLRQGLSHFPKQVSKKQVPEKVRIGYIGQIGPHKGVHILIDAFQKLGNATNAILKLYGDAERLPDYYRQLTTLAAGNSQVQFMGTFTNDKISQIYEELDILVVPSIWYENSPNTILEAFAHKTPVVASNLGGMAEMVTHNQNGLLFNPGDSQDLAQKLDLILKEPQRLEHLQDNILPPKSLEHEMAELLGIYQRTLSSIEVES